MIDVGRRLFLGSGFALLASPALSPSLALSQSDVDGVDAVLFDHPDLTPWGEEDVDYRSLTDVQWRDRLNALQYRILRREGTERPGSSPLNREHRDGIFACAGCGLPLFSSETKYESGTGWPSFWAPIRGAVATKPDYRLWTPRTEYHCARCEGHQGHVFNDGPQPTRQRWCNNGGSLVFAARSEAV